MSGSSINVSLAEKTVSYNIHLLPDFAAVKAQLLTQIADRRHLIVTDENVYQSSGFFAGIAPESVLVMPPGEQYKNFDSVQRIILRAMDDGLDRRSVFVAVGGGVIGDMTGFAASIFLRGVGFVQVPTTVLSMVDASVGGKTGIDFQGKNLVGTFHQPEVVLTCAEFLQSLPVTEVQNGIAEMVKHGVVASRGHLERLAEIASPTPDLRALAGLLGESIHIKKAIVEVDTRESNQRMLLNFGHTFGHAVEWLSEFAVPHGQAVAMGMVMAAQYGVRTGMCTAASAEWLTELLERFGLPTVCPYAPAELAETMMRDKKKDGDHLNLVLYRQLGEGVIVPTALPLEL